MNTVQPIRDLEKIIEIQDILIKQSYRDFMLFTIGINTGLRISDILSLKVSDVKNKTHIVIIEQKTGKTKRFLINSQLKNEIDKYIDHIAPQGDSYLFVSQKGENKPISRIQAYRILNVVATEVGLEEIGTHTLRKTFAYFHYQQFKDVAILQDIFNHSAPSVTLRYIGINQDMKDNTIDNFHLGR